MPPLPFAPAKLVAAFFACGVALTACDTVDNNAVRTGPQAVHPSPSKLAQGTPVAAPAAKSRGASADGRALADQLFAQYCVGKTAAQSEAAVVASGQFGKLILTQFSRTGARFATYPYKARDRASITIVTRSIGGLQCSVGIDNAGPNLYEDGRITRSGY